MVKGVIVSLKPFAKIHGSTIQLHSNSKSWYATYEPEELGAQLFMVMVRIIALHGENTNLHITLAPKTKVHESNLRLIIDCKLINSGLIEKLKKEINPVVISESNKEGKISLKIPLDFTMNPTNYREKKDHSLIKPWYNEIRKRLTNHFKSIDNLEKAAAFRSEAEAEYLKKVNDLIQSRMHCESFHVEELAKSLNISRAQLFRKLKPLVQMSPGRYIRFVRLESARQILQKGSHNVTEAALAVGFVNVSHFSRSFYKQFGFTPSQIQGKAP